MTPFGAINSVVQRPEPVFPKDSVASQGQPDTGAQIRFMPHSQVLHGPSLFSIVVEDPAGIPPEFRLSMYYNGMEVSNQFLSRMEKVNLDSSGRRLKISAKFLRLMPDRDHKIKVVYERNAQAAPIIAEFLPPTCSPFESSRRLASVPDFQSSVDYIDLINQHAARKNLNPQFVGGLIAQESGFNPRAVSGGKAVGLTQITSSGEAEVLKTNKNWPRYPGLAEMPLPFLKLAVMNRTINPSNEWRVDPARSIQGGVDYIGYLVDYWNKPEKQNQLNQIMGDNSTASLAEIILASYNAGPARITQSLDKYGTKWIDDRDLGDTKKYVKRIVSYCDHFSSER